MSSHRFTESEVEAAALEWLEDLGYEVRDGAEIAPGEPAAERSVFGDVLLLGRITAAVRRLNEHLPPEGVEEAVRKVARLDAPTTVAANRRFHAMLRDGVEVEVRRPDGSVGGDRARLVDYDTPGNNDWLAVNQFTVTDGHHNRRPDVVVFLNGVPVAVIELKNAADANADVWHAYQQLQTYKKEVPALFRYNELLVASDGLDSRVGSLTAGKEWFKPWKTVDGDSLAKPTDIGLEVLLRGVFDRKRLLRLLRHFVVFEEADDGGLAKVLAGYHQFHAVRHAVDSTVKAASAKGDRRAGVVWHTQGSGKSLTMLFYAGEVILRPEMENPTIVVLTDRNDLDDQLFGQFLRGHELLRQKPVQAESVQHLRELLRVASGGVVFTTLQKFLPDEKGGRFPLLTDRRNVVVIADEAHRSQYDLIDGLARNLRDGLPGASFIGFTGTPIETTDANTRAVFGDYVSVYDVEQAVKDGATVPIYYESRVARLSLAEEALPRLDAEIEELTEAEEVEKREKLKSKWAALEALVGDPKRLRLIAEDLVAHFERRLEAMDGKAMVVCMSRRICVALYEEITKLRRDWHDPDDDKGTLKIVMTGSASDAEAWQDHIRNKPRRKALAERFKDPSDPFRVVIVRDMWLTGFDAPCLHTMYLDKPMRGHGLMQAIARVNRVFRDKPGGLVVDYLGIADQLRGALAAYTQGGGRGQPSVNTAEAVAVLLEKYEVCCGILHGFDWSLWKTGTPAQRLGLLPAAQEHVLAQDDGRPRWMQAVTDLSQAFALCAAQDEALAIRDDVGYFQAVRAAMAKPAGERTNGQDLDHAVWQLISKAVVASDQVIDVFEAAGLKKPDISVLSDEFLADVRGLRHKNVAAELLRKLLENEIRTNARRNVVRFRAFSELLMATLNGYRNRAIATQEVIEELIRLAKQIREANRRGEELGLSDDEVAFYDALASNGSAVEAMGVPELKLIAAELVGRVRRSVSIDWARRESARAKIRVMVRRILRKHGYPPDLQEEAVRTVLEQAEELCAGWAEAA